MERTTKIFLLNDTSKALQNQDFSENWFRSGHSFSSQGRYNHFDTAACFISNALPAQCHERVPRRNRRKNVDNP